MGDETVWMIEPPKTVGSAVSMLTEHMDSGEYGIVLNIKEPEGMIQFHFSLGMWIRNTFHLWTDNEELRQDCKNVAIENGQILTDMEDEEMSVHPDDCSHTILEMLWNTIHILEDV